MNRATSAADAPSHRGAADRPSHADAIRELSDLAESCSTDTSGRRARPGMEIDASALARRLADGTPPLLLDVRTVQESAICRIEGARLIPIQELAARFRELSADEEIVVYCHHVRSLVGGVDAWSTTIDSGVPRY